MSTRETRSEALEKSVAYAESVIDGMFSGARKDQVERHLSRQQIATLVAIAYQDGHRDGKKVSP